MGAGCIDFRLVMWLVMVVVTTEVPQIVIVCCGRSCCCRQAIEDKTFGLKNKNKSKSVQVSLTRVLLSCFRPLAISQGNHLRPGLTSVEQGHLPPPTHSGSC